MRVLDADVPGPVLDEEARATALRIAARYPTPRSAMLPLLYLVQSVVGWVPRRGMREVGEILGITTAEVEAVATFYSMLQLHPCGRYVMSICTNPSCGLLGGRALYDHAKEALGPESEHVTEDGLFTLEEEECLAACDKAPVVALNFVYYDRMTPEGLDQMIQSMREGQVPPASRGGVPGDLKEVSRILAGLGTEPEAPGARGRPAERREDPNQPTRPSGAGGPPDPGEPTTTGAQSDG